jgi:hypothetical protein
MGLEMTVSDTTTQPEAMNPSRPRRVQPPCDYFSGRTSNTDHLYWISAAIL